MQRYSSSVRINRPPDKVFPYLVDPTKQAQWADIPLRLLNSGPLRLGSRMELTLGRWPIRFTRVLEFTNYEQDRRLAFRTFDEGSVSWSGEYRLEPTESFGTRLSHAGELRFSGLAARLFEPIVGFVIRWSEIRQLRRLKEIIERGS